MKLYHGDCLEILKDFPDESIDAIITDPPYPKKYLYLYETVAKEAQRLLVDGGSLLYIVPHYAMPQVLESVGKHLKYRWICSMWQQKGPHARMAMGIEILWKPIVWWVKRAWPQRRGFVVDGFECPKPSKKLHKWEQDISWANYCMKFVPDDGVVLDPFMGSGTLGVACLEHGKEFIGIEIDEEYYKIAQERVENHENN